MEIIECLEGLVGVSDVDCPCHEADRPTEYNESKSGLFIGDKLDLKMMGKAATGCGAGSIWDVGAKSIRKATENFQTNLLQCWADKHNARKSYIGHLAEITHTKAISPSGAYAGIKIIPNPHIESGEMIISAIGTLFTQSGSDNRTVYIYDAASLLYTLVLDTQASALQENNLDPVITIPFQRDGVSDQAFYLIYAVDANKPRNNELICSCRQSVRDKIADWAPLVEGVHGTDLETREDWSTDNTYAFGLVPDVRFRCNAIDAICDGEFDFASDPNAGTIAQHIQFAAAADMIGSVLRSTDPNIFTLHPSEELVGMRKEYMLEAAARLQGLCKTMAPGSCYKCKDKGGMETLKF